MDVEEGLKAQLTPGTMLYHMSRRSLATIISFHVQTFPGPWVKMTFKLLHRNKIVHEEMSHETFHAKWRVL